MQVADDAGLDCNPRVFPKKFIQLVPSVDNRIITMREFCFDVIDRLRNLYLNPRKIVSDTFMVTTIDAVAPEIVMVHWNIRIGRRNIDHLVGMARRAKAPNDSGLVSIYRFVEASFVLIF